ncbi:MAG: magnesium/cobalt transporter CorA [Bacteroidetes bacterium]|nr:magnesium/cobalt transporter CorA [Bacteroidota bacterium]
MMENSSSRISYYHYNAQEYTFFENVSPEECSSLVQHSHVNWYNVVGISDRVFMQRVADTFKIHPLVLDDITNPNQRAKIEEYDDMLYIVLRMFFLKEGKIDDQQISFVLHDNALLTFREVETGLFKKSVGEKIALGSGNLRKNGEDYLLYTLLDVIIDNYYLVLAQIGEEIEVLDLEILSSPKDNHLALLQGLKGNVLYIRKNILPVRDLINNLIRFEISYFDTANKYYLRDLQDHMQRNVDEIDFQRDQLASLMDLYYSLQTHKMNNVMKTLTGVSFVLLPLTFLASLYGMNFINIPHANDPYGFYEVVAAMLIIAIGLTLFAFRRDWLSTKDFSNRDRS